MAWSERTDYKQQNIASMAQALAGSKRRTAETFANMNPANKNQMTQNTMMDIGKLALQLVGPTIFKALFPGLGG